MENIKLGKYQHFKGGVYEVIGLAKHSETLEEMIVYKNEKGDIWVRPKDMFFENVLIEGKEIPRFKHIGD